MFHKKYKNTIDKFKNLFKIKNKSKKDLPNKDLEIDFWTLPEKVSSNLKLDEIVTFRFLFRTWIIILLLIYIWFISVNSLDIIYTIITAFIISMALESIIWFFDKYIPRWVSIILSYVIFVFILLLGFIILIPFLISYIAELISILTNQFAIWQHIIETKTLTEIINSWHIPNYFKDKLLSYLNDPQLAWDIKNFIVSNISTIVQNSWSYVKNISSFAFSTIWWIFGILSQLWIVFMLAIFFSFEKDKVVYTIATLSKTPRNTALKMKKLYFQLGEWLKWQILLGLFIWFAVFSWLFTLGLFWINLENKWTLSLIAWLMEFIPYLWPILWAIPALLVWTMSYWMPWFIAISVLFVIIQQIEWLIVPVIMNKALWVSPLLIFIAMLIGLKTMWLVWIVLAIPFAVIISLLFEDSLKKN